jgi:hypothetical protein
MTGGGWSRTKYGQFAAVSTIVVCCLTKRRTGPSKGVDLTSFQLRETGFIKILRYFNGFSRRRMS